MNAVVRLDEAVKDTTVDVITIPNGQISLRDDAELPEPFTPDHERQQYSWKNYAEALKVGTTQNVDIRMQGRRNIVECTERNESQPVKVKQLS